MYQAKYGTYDGKSWEAFFQKILKSKYDTEGYQEVVARTHGDLGIEGFTSSGKVFQCYCPDEKHESKKIYSLQRTKINSDLNKVRKNKGKLKNILIDSKLKEWIFITPDVTNKELIEYCKKKALEFRNDPELAELVDSKFDILVKDEDFFLNEIYVVNQTACLKIELRADDTDKDELISWKRSESESVEIVHRKLSATGAKVERKVDVAIKNLIKGQKVLGLMESSFPQLYEVQQRIKKAVGNRLESDWLYSELSASDFLKETIKKYRMALESENFSKVLEYGVVDDICEEAISDWLVRCHLHFDPEE